MHQLLGELHLSVPSSGRARKDDDPVDRLNYRVTPIILLLFCVIVTSRTYVWDPITCWTPAEFTSAYVEYTNRICWIQNTYHVPISYRNIPPAHVRPRQMINYYQWIPIILSFQALLFAWPIYIWRILSGWTGLNLTSVVEAAVIFRSLDGDCEREKKLKFIADHVHSYLRVVSYDRTSRLSGRTAFGRRSGFFLTASYLFTKFVFWANTVSQLFWLNLFLGNNFHFYGVEVLSNWLNGAEWNVSPRFPRVTLCDFHVRNLANIHKHTIQCVLPINLFNEKIYIFLWFWLVFLSLVTLISLLVWTMRMLRPDARARFAYDRLRLYNEEHRHRDKKEVRKLSKDFVRNYLRLDGLLIFHLLEANTSSLLTSEVFYIVWSNFDGRSKAKELTGKLTDDAAAEELPSIGGKGGEMV